MDGLIEHDSFEGIDKMLFPKAVVRIADKKTGAYMLNIRFRYSRLLSLRASILASIGYMFFFDCLTNFIGFHNCS